MSAQDSTISNKNIDFRLLAADWRDWGRIVRLYATRHSRVQQLVPDEYQVLYSEIMRQLQAFASTDNEHWQREFKEMEKLVRPWCNLESFHKADRDLLFLLVEQCKSVQRFLDNQNRPAWLSPRAVLLAGCIVLGVGVATLFTTGQIGGAVKEVTGGVMGLVGWGVDLYHSLSQEERYILLGGGIAAMTTYIIVKSARKV